MDLALPEGQMNASEFLATTGSWRVLIDLVLIGFFGGIYIVPLNATVQKRSYPQRRARVIAALSILSGLFMVASTLTTLAMLKMGLTTPQIFLVLAVLNIIITGVFFILQPEFLRSFVRWLRFTNNE
jgi:hypothetical protein